uniref:Serine-threonine/tyrosine-protein kinase catalytic domain-containing protein n=1 Tax=Rhizophagus irregularis (strain DAOM 181602 / DAOM 197198 / MUCL 43194) TaxID=747089 RepID=U9TUR4_RHIID
MIKFEYYHWVEILHFKEIIHRLALKDILVNNGKLIIADFGLSKKLAEVITNSVGNRDEVVEYIEPQCFKNINHKKVSSGRRPFSGYPRNLLNDHIKDSNKEKPIEGTYTSKVLKSLSNYVGMTNQNQDRY